MVALRVPVPSSPTEILGVADLHVHSHHSDGLASVRQIVEHAAEHTVLDIIAIADHDQVRGALEAVEWCAGRPGRRLQAIVATEISAAWGRHVLALFFAPPFPTTPFPRFRPLLETIATVHAAGGVVALPHPYSTVVPSVGERTLRNLLAGRATHPELQALQAIEICTGALGGRRLESRLRRANDASLHLAPLGNSDAHHLAFIASAFTRFPGRTPADLRRAIEDRATQAHWGAPAQVSLGAYARQSWRSMVIKPARELREALRKPEPPPTASRPP
ncbi:MAG: PHP domain-containing protein [Chloroflexota bacterium]|nr:PHP domain-containing protein [Chloroflexota bacterium]